jgi:hypothetical protein
MRFDRPTKRAGFFPVAMTGRDRPSGYQAVLQTAEPSSRPLYLANGFGRIWNFTAFGSEPLPPSMCHDA